MLPDDYKGIGNLNIFKNKIKKWKPESSKVYINNIGFVSQQKRNLEYSVALVEVFLLLASIFFTCICFTRFLTSSLILACLLDDIS